MATLNINTSCVLLIDMQTGLLPAIADQHTLISNATKLVTAAKALKVPVLATEHWVDKIGPTHANLTPFIDKVFHKTFFDATLEPGFEAFMPAECKRILIIGTEAHVCVLQTGLGLMRLGYEPVLVTDCIGSRTTKNLNGAIYRWQHYGLEPITYEMAIFEWLQNPAHSRSEEHT